MPPITRVDLEKLGFENHSDLYRIVAANFERMSVDSELGSHYKMLAESYHKAAEYASMFE